MLNLRSFSALFEKLIALGISVQTPASLARRVKLTNQISLVLIGITSQYIFIFPWMGYPKFGFLAILVVLGFVVVFGLNSVRLHTTARFWVILVVDITILYCSCSLSKVAGVQLVYFALLAIPLAIFNIKEWGKVVIGILVPLISFIALEMSYYSFFPAAPLSSLNIQIIYFSAAFATFAINGLFLFFFFVANENYQDAIVQTKLELEKVAHDLQTSLEIQKDLSQKAVFGTLMSGIAHEIKNPVTVISGSADVVARLYQNNALDNPNFQEGLSHIQTSAARLNEIVDTMLQFGAPKVVHQEVVDLGLIFQEVLRVVRFKQKQKGATITLNPSETNSFLIQGDSTPIYQALVNLLINAIEALEDNKGQVKISLSKTDHVFPEGLAPGVMIQIADNGCGIPDDVLPNIFTPLFTTKNAQNRGFGLALVKQIVEDHGGTISLTVTPNQGTCFTLVFREGSLVGESFKASWGFFCVWAWVLAVQVGCRRIGHRAIQDLPSGLHQSKKKVWRRDRPGLRRRLLSNTVGQRV